jgi:hypothetical protein
LLLSWLQPHYQKHIVRFNQIVIAVDPNERNPQTALTAWARVNLTMIDWESLAQRLTADGEFLLAARRWTATLRLDVGDESHAIRLEDGQVKGVTRCAATRDCDVFITAPRHIWEQMLQPLPRPFYQDLLAAAAHHGVLLNSDWLDIAAYYPALRRLVEILRESRDAQ